jgi:superfamily I DNA and/or RNA helicase
MTFPSEKFYNGKLTIGQSEQANPSTLDIWPSGGEKPIVFINVVGLEETLTVATEEGSERSKSNALEIDMVVSWTELKK